MKNIFSLRTSLIASACFSILIGMSGCQMTENTLKADRATHQDIQDFRDMLAPREAPVDQATNNNIPALQPYVSDTSGSLKPMPLVSIAINQSIPLRDALFELAKQADFDIQLDPRIKGSIIYTARNKPFELVMSQISELAGLRYKFEDDTVKVELDTPYTKTYKVEYLAMTRESKSSIDTSTKVSSGDSGSGPTSGSSFGISGESKTDFWGELDTNVKQILEANSQLNYQITDSDPEISVSSSAPPVPPLDEGALGESPLSAEPQAGEEKRSSRELHYSAGQSIPQVPLNSSAPQSVGDVPTGSSVPPTTSPPDDQSATAASQPLVPLTQQTPEARPQQVQLNVNSLPTVAATGGAGSAGGAGGGATYQPSYSLNKQAGLISVYATQKAHDQISSYLGLMRRSVTSQVLIEAKVLEVELSDEFTYGINWDVFNDGDTFGASLNVARSALDPQEPATFVIQNGSNGLENLISAIQRFGTVHALASPRLTVLNNQAAVLNVAENQVYFELAATRTEGDDNEPDTIDVTSTIKNVPEGVLINVMPAIDLDRNAIQMQVRPTISRITGSVNDPAIPIMLAQSNLSVDLDDEALQSSIPVVSTKEVDTVLNMQSGQTLVMGGLLEDRSEGTQRAVPILGELPVVGAAFRGQDDRILKSEIVLLIKATIIQSPDQTIHNTDRDLYRVYSQDRRPFKL